jgi:hypothetical protein
MSLKDVVSLKEASGILGTSDANIRKGIKEGRYNKKMYRKTDGGGYIFVRKYIEELKKKRDEAS